MISGLYTSAPGSDVICDVAATLRDVTKSDPLDLRHAMILLPTRRAIRALESELLQVFSQKTILLPKLFAIGDIELPPEDEDMTVMPPRVINGIERVLSILPFVQKHRLGGNSLDGQWHMAQQILKLIDLLETEEVAIKVLGDIIKDADLAQHWQDNGGLFEIIADEWQAHLRAHKRINAAAGRTLRVHNLAETLRTKPPQHPVWMVGSTGSIPAVRRLMKSLLTCELGAVILPGLDKHMNDTQWRGISAAHPQAILKRTLAELGFDRREVKDFNTISVAQTQRSLWLSNALNGKASEGIDTAANDMTIIAARHEEEEARTIARYCIDQLHKNSAQKIVIIANDPDLAVRLGPHFKAHSIELDSSGGIVASHTSLGRAMISFLCALTDHDNVIAFWSLLKRNDFMAFWDLSARTAIMMDIEHSHMRNPLKAPRAINDVCDLLPQDVQHKWQNLIVAIAQNRTFSDWAEVIITLLHDVFSPRNNYDTMISQAIIEQLETMASTPSNAFFSFADIAPVFCDQIRAMKLSLKTSRDKKVTLLGTMEARLIHADIVIMAGLNEGKWPDAPQPNPFISRGMRHRVGLPDTERHAALAGHDFQQAFMARRVVVTYANRCGDSPALPARWIIALKSVTDPELWQDIMRRGADMIEYYGAPQLVTNYAPSAPPRPTARSSDIPTPISVTHMETWRADPYSYWAKHIVRLRKKEAFLGPVTPQTRGILWHEIVQIFVHKFDRTMTDTQASNMFDVCVETVFNNHDLPAHKRRAWRNRLGSIKKELITFERERRAFAKPLALEKEWRGTIGNYDFKARADRVDVDDDGQIYALDYKTGDNPPMRDILNGYACQLTLLALLSGRNVKDIAYLNIKGGHDGFKSTNVSWDEDLASVTHDGALRWLDEFAVNGAAYISLADHGKWHRDKAADYLALARYGEWGIGA